MDEAIREQLTKAIRDGKEDIALTILENHDRKAIQFLWQMEDIPDDVGLSENSLLWIIDRPIWMRFSKKLHQRVRLEIFTSSSVIFMGALVLLWGILEVSALVQSGQDYLPEIKTFCIIPFGILIVLAGTFWFFATHRWLRQVKSHSKKKRS